MFQKFDVFNNTVDEIRALLTCIVNDDPDIPSVTLM
jgi:hypothetical protein